MGDSSTLSASTQRYAKTWQHTVVRRTGWKARLRSVARRIGLDVKSVLGQHDPGPSLRCLACHYVFDDQRADFQRTIRALKNLGDFIDTPTMMAMMNSDQPIDGRYFPLSFDDGFKNVIDNALPILSELQVPMIMFVPTAWVSADWETAKHYSIEIAEYRDVVEMATWDELRSMVSAGFEIGSHTCTHARLSHLTDDRSELERELIESKQEIEKQLERPCNYIAYPYGKPGDYDDVTLAATKAAGYEAGFGIHRGAISSQTNSMLVPRHHFEPEWPTRHVTYFASGNMEDYWNRKLQVAGVGVSDNQGSTARTKS